MNDFTRLARAAYKPELAAARKLAAGSGMDPEQALRAVLERSAGAGRASPQPLSQLLAQREAALAQDEQRKAGRDERRAQARAAQQRKHEGPPTPWRAWFDGSAHPNPGRCGIGGVVTGPDGEHIELSQPAGHGNSSEAEYRALIAVLAAAIDAGAGTGGLTVHGDSSGVIDDVNGEGGAGAASLAPYRAQARALMARIDGLTVRWLPRHKNAAADALSQRAVAAGMAGAPLPPEPDACT